MATKGNKEVLKSVNYSINIIKKIKEDVAFTQEEKQKILIDFVGMSEDNNSYFTPFEICNFIKDLLNITSGKIIDPSAGIGNMIRPYIKEYGKLLDGIEFTCFEFDENNSLAGYKAFEDYEQVKYNTCFNSLDRVGEIKDNYYDYVIGNPPFVGSVEYLNEFNNTKGKAKKTDIVSCFIDLSIKKCKDKGYIALVLPGGHLFKGNAVQKLRDYMKGVISLKGIFPLDADTFSEAGILGTSVGTNLLIWQKGTPQGKVFIGDLADKKDLKTEMSSIALQFQLFLSGDYYLEQSYNYAKLIKGVGVDWEPQEKEEEVINGIECHCCNKKFPEYQISEYTSKDGLSIENICIECENDSLTYMNIIKRNFLIDGESYEVTRADEREIKKEESLKREKDEAERKRDCKKSILYLSNAEKFDINYQIVKYANGFIGTQEDSGEDNIQRCKFNYGCNKHWSIDKTWDKNLGKVDIHLDSFKKEIQRVRKPGAVDWRERTRIWWSGRILCEEDFYNATFGFSTYSDDEIVKEVYVNYQFICSKSYSLSKKIMELLKEDGFKVKE
ncbi:SAM-dependent methyltransferase [Clostridium estertheticum]|uniref:N-6 DNA methylase n=1 Tax=Clostridium estertheticum TaxID=238834 RepID=UPI001C0AF9F8|nr:N-6 DNA methylase [Clostridium estertheticum]MBU3216661.1 SAM-dependent methyltransferase [Clostridium estertheticum]WAG54383.1 SAM-dependent methyltransferase [Clostridium estertheticum]